MSEFFKKQFENYEEQPKAELWDSIMSAVKRHNAAKRVRVISAVAASAVIAGAVATLLLVNRNTETPEPVVASAQPVVASEQVVVENETPVVEEQNVAAVAETPKATINAKTTNAVASPVAKTVSEKTTQTKETRNDVAIVTNEKEPVVAETPAAPQAQTTVAAATTHQSNAPAKQPVVENNNKTMTVDNTNTSSSDDGGPVASELKIAVPTGIAPDQGQCFRVYSTRYDLIKSFELFIYNRSGMLVFHTKDINECWDGTYKGKIMPVGACTYIVIYSDEQNKKHVEKGTVTVVR